MITSLIRDGLLLLGWEKTQWINGNETWTHKDYNLTEDGFYIYMQIDSKNDVSISEYCGGSRSSDEYCLEII